MLTRYLMSLLKGAITACPNAHANHSGPTVATPTSAHPLGVMPSSLRKRPGSVSTSNEPSRPFNGSIASVSSLSSARLRRA